MSEHADNTPIPGPSPEDTERSAPEGTDEPRADVTAGMSATVAPDATASSGAATPNPAPDPTPMWPSAPSIAPATSTPPSALPPTPVTPRGSHEPPIDPHFDQRDDGPQHTSGRQFSPESTPMRPTYTGSHARPEYPSNPPTGYPTASSGFPEPPVDPYFDQRDDGPQHTSAARTTPVPQAGPAPQAAPLPQAGTVPPAGPAPLGGPAPHTAPELQAAPGTYGTPEVPSAPGAPTPSAYNHGGHGQPPYGSHDTYGGYPGQAVYPPPPTSRPPRKARVGALGIVAIAVGAAIIGGGAGAGVGALVANSRPMSMVTPNQGPANVVVNNTDSVNAVTAATAKASPSVVTVQVQSASNSQTGGTGSGIILTADGYIVTNTHVVTVDGTVNDPVIQVQTSDGKLYSGKLVATDPLMDTAVIKLANASGLTPADFADSNKVNVGDTLIAIGAPRNLPNTVTDGIASNVNRSIAVASSDAPKDSQQQQQQQGQQSPFGFWNYGNQQQRQQQQSVVYLPTIQTDAAINPGNSGGALVNTSGQVIGMNVAILSTSSGNSTAGNIGIGFAIPSNVVKRVANELIQNGKATHGLFGAQVSDAGNTTNATTVGASLGQITAGGPADKAGLKQGDIVTNFAGRPVTNGSDLTALVRSQAGGAQVQVTFIRDGQQQSTTMTLGTYTA